MRARRRSASLVQARAAPIQCPLRHGAETGLQLIKDYPMAGISEETGRRYVLVRHFPYLVVYTVAGREVAIVAVAHTARRPGYWRDR